KEGPSDERRFGRSSNAASARRSVSDDEFLGGGSHEKRGQALQAPRRLRSSHDAGLARKGIRSDETAPPDEPLGPRDAAPAWGLRRAPAKPEASQARAVSRTLRRRRR